MSVDAPRRTAYALLRAVHTRDAYANLTLPRLLAEGALTGRDAAFTTELGYGALRWQASLDAVLAACVDRPLDVVDRAVLDGLRLGAYQLLHMRVPAHAAVSATVDLVREATGPGPARFANAVLRRVAARDWPSWIERLAPARPGAGEPDEGPPGAERALVRMALQRGYPEWVARAFAQALGDDLAETDRALAADRPMVHLAARPGRIDREALLRQAGVGARPAPWSPYGVHLTGGGDPGALDAVRTGRAQVQDEGSQLMALALVATPLEGPDRRWLDLCAGPGGKAALLAGLGAQRGAHVLAVEPRAHRAALLADALAGVDTAQTVVADGTRPAWRGGSMDRVLVDAPCTGLGALRRRPEARWRRKPEDPIRLGQLQCALLHAALDAARAGGVVGYVTCSPHPAETVAVVAAVLEARPDVDWVDARESLRGVPDLGPGPSVQLWPHRHGTDAMFLALLRRRALSATDA